MRRATVFLFLAVGVSAILLAMASPLQAGLTVIGTATYNGSDYKLIWEDDNNGNSLVWLDYSAPAAYWANQKAWAAGLDANLTYHIDPSYTVTWSDSSWRLPSAGNAPAYGCQAATQEMGHLYYTGLGLTGGSSSSGVVAPDLAASVFDNLQLTGYWTSTAGEPVILFSKVINTAWAFYFEGTRSSPYNDTVYGFQDVDAVSGTLFGIPLAVKQSGLAVRSGDVSGSSAVPEPATLIVWSLLGALSVTIGWRRRRSAEPFA